MKSREWRFLKRERQKFMLCGGENLIAWSVLLRKADGKRPLAGPKRVYED
jgi:hypothetical protein